MKDIFAFIGLWVVCMLALAVLFGDSKSTTSDAAIKEKVELIALTEKSDDAVLRGQAEVAKVELEAIREAKLAAIAKDSLKATEDEKAVKLKEEAKSQASTPISSKQEARLETVTSIATIFAAIAMALIILTFAMRSYRRPA